MKLDHVLLPCKMTSVRIPRKNLALIGERTLLDRAIDQWQAWFPETTIWVATEDGEAAGIARARGCEIYPLTERDLSDQDNVSELFTRFLYRQPTESRCAYQQLTSPFTLRSEIITAVNDPRPYCRSAWKGKLVSPTSGAFPELTQNLPDSIVLTGNFAVANGRHTVTGQDESTHFSEVSWLSATDINTSGDLKQADILAQLPLSAFDDAKGTQ